MGVTTTKTNKPLNPRGNDQSPKGFNRAKLFSGKALDFDGVNDSVSVPYSDTLGGVWSWVSIIEADALSGYQELFGGMYSGSNATIYLKENQLTIYTNQDNLNTAFDFETGKKYHIACSQSGDTISVYVNGQAAGSVSLTIPLNSTSGTYIIGKRPNQASEYFNGKISGVRLFNTALTAAQVADLYNNPEKVVPTGVDNTALKLWLPMMEGAGTTAYDGAPDALGSNVVTNGTFDTDLTGWSTNDFSNGSIVQSSGTALITSNGGSGYPSIWQQVSTIVGERYIVKANFSNNTTGVWFWKFDDNTPLGSTNRVQFIDNDATTSIDGVFEFTATSTLSSISAFAEQGNAGSFNLDNVEVLQISNVGTISGATWTHGIGSPVGQTSVIDWNKHTLDGTNEVLIPQGLTAGRDLLGNLFENVRKQGALNLDGNSWAEVHDNASFDFGTAVSLEAWVYWQGDNDDDGIIGRYGSTNAERDCTLYAYSGGIQFYVTLSAVSYTSMTNGWRHIVGTYDGANKRLYVDGAQVNSSAETSTMPGGSIPVEIGRYNENASTTFTQPIAQPRIYNRALTAEEVQRNYNAGKNIYTN